MENSYVERHEESWRQGGDAGMEGERERERERERETIGHRRFSSWRASLVCRPPPSLPVPVRPRREQRSAGRNVYAGDKHTAAAAAATSVVTNSQQC